ncbi:UTP4 small subunit processome component l(3)72Dn [Glossina fuscipes fuscipes]
MKMENSVCDLRKRCAKIHNVRFYNITPRSIQTMAYNFIWGKLALARCDGSIEIWDVSHAPCLERVIPKTPGNSVECMGWCGKRLFSAGLNGEIVEWNLQSLQPRVKQHVTGNTVWCLDINREGTELAIGTDEGYINLFDVTDNQLLYKKLFDKQEGRVLCCAYDATSEFLVTGSVGAIRIWNCRTGHAVNKINISANKYNKAEAIVWSVKVLSDFTIITGDSLGNVTMWDGRMASQTETHQVLKADVLALAVNEEEDKLICAGVEPNIRIYAKALIKRNDATCNRWVKFLQRRVHDHDVKALVCAKNFIYSGGVDGCLGLSSVAKNKIVNVKYGPFLKPPCVSVASSQRLLLLRYPNYLEIWRLGSPKENSDSEFQEPSQQCQLLALAKNPEKLLELKSKNEDPIVSAALSPNGNWLCYSTPEYIRLFRFTISKGKTPCQLRRVKDLPQQFVPSTHICFTSDSKRLFLVNRTTSEIMIFAVLSADDDLISSLPPLDFVELVDTTKHVKDGIKLFTVSVCGTYVAIAGNDRSIAVWFVYKGKHFKHLLNLPRYAAATTALALHAELPRLVAAFADGKIFEYDLEEMCFTCSAINQFVKQSEHACITNICLDSRNPEIMIMQTEAVMFVLEKYSIQQETEDAHLDNSSKAEKFKKCRTSSNEESKVLSLRLKQHKAFQHLVHLCWLSSDELVAVIVDPITLLEQLPNVFREKLFGIM